MKKTVLIKSIENIQAGHLYEHIFCMQLAEYFRAENLYSYLDYHIDAKTYYNGYIKLEVTLYSKAAIELQKMITSLPFVVDDDVIDGAVLQIMAEKRMNFFVTDHTLLVGTLKDYSSRPWSTLGEVGEITFTPNKKDALIELTPRSASKFLILKQVIRMDNAVVEGYSKNSLNPIFVVISQVLTNNLQQIIADTVYCYSYEDFVTISSTGIRNTNLYRIDKRQNTQLTIEKELAETFVKELLEHGLVEKLEAFLSGVSYDSPSLAPDEDYISESIGVLVGAEGWRAIGTKANILHVLESMSIDFRLGKTHQSVSLKNFI